MTKGIFTLCALLALPLAGLASAWPTTTYDQIIAGRDCSIADKTFSRWSSCSSPSGGKTLAQASTVEFKPRSTPNNPRVSFSFGVGASVGQVQPEVSGFSVIALPGSGPFTDIHLLMLGAAFRGTESASLAKSVCTGDLFTDGYTSGNVASLCTFDKSTLVKLLDGITFAPVTVVDVIEGFELTGRTDGNAVVSAVENHFSEATIPESGTLALVGIGVICLGGLLRRRLGSDS